MDENNQPNEGALDEEEFRQAEAALRELETERKIQEAELKRLVKRAQAKEKWLRFRNLASVIMVVIGTLGVILITSTLFPQRLDSTFKTEDQQATIDEIAKQLERKLETQIQEIEEGVQDLSIVPQNTAVGANLRRLDFRLARVDGRLNKLEGVILEDPSESLEIVLLRRDIGDITKDVSALQEDIEKGFDRIYNLGTWLIGLLLPLFVTLIASAVNNLRRQGKDSQQEP